MERPARRFSTKLVLAVGASVLAGLAASLAVALYSTHRLAAESSKVIHEGLEASSHEYLSQYIEDTARQTDLLFRRAMDELEVAGDVAQTFVDHADELAAIETIRDKLPFLDGHLTLHDQPSYWQSSADVPCIDLVNSYLLDEQKQLRPDVRALVRRNRFLVPVLQALQQRGSRKQQIYFVGPAEAPWVLLCPWADLGTIMEKLYPGANEHPFWAFFFPGLVEGWNAWAANPAKLKAMPTQVTVVPPNEDAGGAGLIVTFFRPVWRRDFHFAGAVGMDITLKQLETYIEQVRVIQSGFAFLAQPNGNVLIVNSAGEATLELHAGSKTGSGLNLLDRPLARSGAPAIAALALPGDERLQFSDVDLHGERHIVVQKRLPAFNVITDKGIVPEQWTLGFVVPTKEIYASLVAAQATIGRRTSDIVTSQIALAALTLLLMIAGVALVSQRMTRALKELGQAAQRIMRKDYSRVDIRSQDEIGQLGTAFNAMAGEIQKQTETLEQRVQERTEELEKANQEISVLADKLKAENVRLGTELDVARRLQMMVLPQARELKEISELDVVGFMQPATEVGGDYYDVVRTASGVNIGIGDVTGHGLESGVLMLMLQTAIRTLMAADERDLGRILEVVNKVLYQNVQRINMEHSATLSLMNYTGGTLTLTGQHEEAIIVRAGGEVERIQTMDLGFPVGIEFDISAFIVKTSIQLGKGDVVVLYTDGVTEAENIAKEQYGTERLCDVARRYHAGTAMKIKEAILADVTGFIGVQVVLDDITLVVAKRV